MALNINIQKYFSSLNWNKVHFKIGLQIGFVITLAAVFAQIPAEIAAILAILTFGLAMQLGLEKGLCGPVSVSAGIAIPAIIITFLAGVIAGKFTLLLYVAGGIIIAYLISTYIYKLPGKNIG